MDVGPAFVPDGKPSESVQPGQGALHHPAVPAQPLARLDPSTRDAALNAAAPKVSAANPVIVGFIGVQLVGPPTRPRPHGPLMGGMASNKDTKTVQSWRLAAVTFTASGMPWPSTTTWRFVPALPRSVGLGPVA